MEGQFDDAEDDHTLSLHASRQPSMNSTSQLSTNELDKISAKPLTSTPRNALPDPSSIATTASKSAALADSLMSDSHPYDPGVHGSLKFIPIAPRLPGTVLPDMVSLRTSTPLVPTTTDKAAPPQQPVVRGADEMIQPPPAVELDSWIHPHPAILPQSYKNVGPSTLLPPYPQVVVEPYSGGIRILTSRDVVLGRGGLANHHPGNKWFRSIVSQYQMEYCSLRKLDKKQLARNLVSYLRHCGGRFVSKCKSSSSGCSGNDHDNDDDTYHEVGDERAIIKTSQTLREGTSGVIRQTLQENLTDPPPATTNGLLLVEAAVERNNKRDADNDVSVLLSKRTRNEL